MTNPPKTILLGVLLSAMFCNALSSQEHMSDTTNIELRKNSVYFHGSFAFVIATWGFSYDRQLARLQDGLYLMGKIGTGKLYTWTDDSQYWQFQIGILSGKKESHFEGFLGYNKHTSRYTKNTVSGLIAYRYQKPGGHLIFRGGVGWPEAGFLSFGFCF